MGGGNWQPIETAPKDGTWLVLEGEFDGGDTSSTRIGRYEPKSFAIGSQLFPYEWRVFEELHAGVDGNAFPIWEWYSEGCVYGWQHLPGRK